MHKFLKRILFGCVFLIAFFIILFAINYFAVTKLFKDSDNTYSVIVLGDSNTECAIDDSDFTRVKNLSKSADSYFYSYLKLREISSVNEKLDTVILGFSPHNIYSSIEARWLLNDKNLRSRMGKYLPLMSVEDFVSLWKGNTLGFTKALVPTLIESTAKMCIQTVTKKPTMDLYGGYFKRAKAVAVNTSGNQPSVISDDSFDLALIELKYLDKIVALCEEQKIHLILLTTPKQKATLNDPSYGFNKFIKLYKSKYSKVEFWNYSDMDLNDNHFADNLHLNNKGARIFTDKLFQSK